MTMKNRVYGVAAIRSIMANWNADFSSRPKTISNGTIFGSDKAFKYPIKRMWLIMGEKVLAIKSYKIEAKSKNDEEEAGKLQPRDLQERYEQIFKTTINDKTPSKEVLKNLFSALDVMNFGATFAQNKQNISITGAVQIGQGFNKYEDAQIETQDILSPYRNSSEKKEEATASTLGSKIVTDEAHYFYPITVNPNNYLDYLDLGIEGFEGYTQEAYDKFKQGCLVAATAFHTNSKSGSENEFALFATCKEGSNLYLPNLDRYVGFCKKDGRNTIILDKLAALLSGHEQDIDRIEVYYNPLDTDVELSGLICKRYDLFGTEI
ncbi:MAG: type I CRISPR-associated protein Cas7 [Veillonellales bacterium]